METDWFVPLVSLNQIGIELQNSFYKSSLNHLPLDEISEGIEKTLQEMLASSDNQELK